MAILANHPYLDGSALIVAVIGVIAAGATTRMAWLDFSRVPWGLMPAARAALVRAALRLGALLALVVLIFIQYGAPEGQLLSRQLASRAATLTLALMLATSAVADYVYRRRLVRVAEERSRSGGESRAA